MMKVETKDDTALLRSIMVEAKGNGFEMGWFGEGYLELAVTGYTKGWFSRKVAKQWIVATVYFERTPLVVHVYGREYLVKVEKFTREIAARLNVDASVHLRQEAPQAPFDVTSWR